VSKGRADRGQPRTLKPEQQKRILEQAQAHLAVPVKVLYRRWREQDPQLPSLNSIYRFLRHRQLHTKARRQQLRQPLGGATKCFEAPPRFLRNFRGNSPRKLRGTLHYRLLTHRRTVHRPPSSPLPASPAPPACPSGSLPHRRTVFRRALPFCLSRLPIPVKCSPCPRAPSLPLKPSPA
jgi:hypothetical protein